MSTEGNAARKYDLPAPLDVETPIDHNYHQIPSARTRFWESTLPASYWAYRKKWEEWPKEHIVGNFPIHLDIEATTVCNLRCVMCPRTTYVDNNTFWKLENFDFDKYKSIIDEGVKNGLCSIKYNFLGEPLLNPRLIEMIQYAKSAGVIDVMFNTNATMLTQELSHQLIDSGLDKLFFSFDSPYKEHYNKIRVGADYDKVLANIKRFCKIRSDRRSVKPFTRASMVLMRDNQKEWEDFKKLFEPLVDAVAYDDYLDHTGQTATGRSVINFKGRKKKFCCPQLWQRMFIHPDGVVTPCCLDAQRELIMGNINEQSPKDIWTNDKYQHLRDLHQSGRYEEISTCAHCPISQY